MALPVIAGLYQRLGDREKARGGIGGLDLCQGGMVIGPEKDYKSSVNP